MKGKKRETITLQLGNYTFRKRFTNKKEPFISLVMDVRDSHPRSICQHLPRSMKRESMNCCIGLTLKNTAAGQTRPMLSLQRQEEKCMSNSLMSQCFYTLTLVSLSTWRDFYYIFSIKSNHSFYFVYAKNLHTTT